MINRVISTATPARIGALVFILLMMVVSLSLPILSLADPIQQSSDRRMPPGTFGHLLGTDALGRDVLSRLLHGLRTELVVALSSTALAAVAGTVVGLTAGYLGRTWEALGMRVMDVILSFPSVILALMVAAIYGAGVSTLIGVMAILFMPPFARITYGMTLSMKNREFVLASRTYGASTWRQLFGEVLPNVLGSVLVQLTLTIAAAVLLESGLSFLGLGIVPPAPSLGGMVADGQRHMATHPYMVVIPALAVSLVILSFSIVGDGLREALDPKSLAFKR